MDRGAGSRAGAPRPATRAGHGLGARHGPLRRVRLAAGPRAVSRRSGHPGFGREQDGGQVSDDKRGWRIALVPDALLNPRGRTRPALPDLLAALATARYGVLQLPPPGQHRLLLAVIADQVAEYAHHGYAVVAIGVHPDRRDGLHWRRLAPLLRHRRVALPPRHLIRAGSNAAAEARRLAEFLGSYDLPVEEQRRWRV